MRRVTSLRSRAKTVAGEWFRRIADPAAGMVAICTILTAASLAASRSSWGPPGPPTIAIVGGDRQSTTLGAPTAEPLVVRVRDGYGAPLADIPVTWSDGAYGETGAEITMTDARGEAKVRFVPRGSLGDVMVIARITGGAEVRFHLIVRPPGALHRGTSASSAPVRLTPLDVPPP